MKNLMKVNGEIKTAGVYAMYTEANGEKKYLYIGSALECNDALSRHLYYLKRGFYNNTNKAILQKYYDLQELNFEVIHKSELNSKLSDMSLKEKENVHYSLSVLEKMYIDLFKDTICNKQRKVTKHSSNKNKMSTYRRRKSNLGSKNPNSKYEEKMIREIIWLKENTSLKNKSIKKIIDNHWNVTIGESYIANIAKTKWIHLTELKPSWYEEAI